MFDKQAIDAISKAEAITAANGATLSATANHAHVVALPADFSLHDLEQYLPLRRRARGRMSTSVLADFAAYTKTHAEAGASVLVSPEEMAARAVLNLGTPDAPGHADNSAQLQLKRTAAYRALLQIANGSGQKQATIAEFIEDWAGYVTCFNDAGEITPPRAAAAVRKITIESLRKLETAEQQLSATRSAFESVQATSGTEPLPTTIYFRCVPYQSLSERSFVLRLSILTSGDKPAIALRITKQEEHDEQMADELAGLVRNALAASGTPVYLGTYGRA